MCNDKRGQKESYIYIYQLKLFYILYAERGGASSGSDENSDKLETLSQETLAAQCLAELSIASVSGVLADGPSCWHTWNASHGFVVGETLSWQSKWPSTSINIFLKACHKTCCNQCCKSSKGTGIQPPCRTEACFGRLPAQAEYINQFGTSKVHPAISSHDGWFANLYKVASVLLYSSRWNQVLGPLTRKKRQTTP